MHYVYVDEVIAKLETKAAEAEAKTAEAKNTVMEMVMEAVEALGEVSETVYERIRNEKDIHVLKSVYKAAMESDCAEQFEEKINNL